MIKKKFKKHTAGRGGWSEWIYPTKDYLFKCCDCGLIHHLQFKTFLERDRRSKVNVSGQEVWEKLFN